MHIVCIKNHGVKYLQVQESYTTNVGGVLKNRKRTLTNIGPLVKFDDGQGDYLKRLRESFKKGKPIIPVLADLLRLKESKEGHGTVKISFNTANANVCALTPKNIGYFLLDGLYDGLGISDVVDKYKSHSKLTYDLNGLTKLLVFGRILNPDSKRETFEDQNRYLLKVTNSKSQIEIYRTLDALNQISRSIQKRLHHKVASSIGRNNEVCFYDVTNYYFSIDQNDEHILDPTGEIVTKGLRRKGVSKEKRSTPIVQMGLFIDSQGIPIGYQLFPGNATDQTTLRPALDKCIYELNFGKVIVVADGGVNTGPALLHLLSKGNGYIVSKSTKKTDRATRAWMLNETGYRYNKTKTFKVKSIIRTRVITDSKKSKGLAANSTTATATTTNSTTAPSTSANNSANTTATTATTTATATTATASPTSAPTRMVIKEKIVSFWSLSHFLREQKENEKFMDYLLSVIAFPDKLKDKQAKISHFLKKTIIDKKTGKRLVDSKTGKPVATKIKFTLDLDKVRQYLDLMGYYTIMTSEIDKSDEEIISKYHGLSRIEDCFRITKSELQARPVYVSTPEHINAHFLICFIALTMIKLIQHKIQLHLGKDTQATNLWVSGLSAARIKQALKQWQADSLPQAYHRLTLPSKDLKLILSAFHIPHIPNLPTSVQLKQLKYSFDKACVM